MKLTDREEYRVARAVLDDAVAFEGATLICDDDEGAAVSFGDWYKCAVADISRYSEFARANGINGLVCLLDAPINAAEVLNVRADACRSFAYFEPLPPALSSQYMIRRLAPTLAPLVSQKYEVRGGGYSVEHAQSVMRGKGVFGAFIDSALAGFIGRHDDGTMGMLTVFENFRRRGIGEELERFMINYVMSFGRVPLCDVFIDNAPSLVLQRKLGLTESAGYTFWFENK